MKLAYRLCPPRIPGQGLEVWAAHCCVPPPPVPASALRTTIRSVNTCWPAGLLLKEPSFLIAKRETKIPISPRCFEYSVRQYGRAFCNLTHCIERALPLTPFETKPPSLLSSCSPLCLVVPSCAARLPTPSSVLINLPDRQTGGTADSPSGAWKLQ